MRTLGDRQRKKAPEVKQEETQVPAAPAQEASTEEQTQSFDESVTIN